MAAIAEPIRRNTSELARKGGELPELEDEKSGPFQRGERQAEALLRNEHAEIAHDDPCRDGGEHAGGANMFGDEE